MYLASLIRVLLPPLIFGYLPVEASWPNKGTQRRQYNIYSGQKCNQFDRFSFEGNNEVESKFSICRIAKLKSTLLVKKSNHLVSGNLVQFFGFFLWSIF